MAEMEALMAGGIDMLILGISDYHRGGISELLYYSI